MKTRWEGGQAYFKLNKGDLFFQLSEVCLILAQWLVFVFV